MDKYNFLNYSKYKNLTLTKNQIEELALLYEHLGTKTFHNSSSKIKHFINAPFQPHWVERFEKVKKCTKNTLQWFEIIYGKEVGKQEWRKKKQSASSSLQSYIIKYGKEQGTRLYQKSCTNKKGQSKEQYYVEKYGTEEGKKRWREIRIKWRGSIDKTIAEGNRKGNGRTLVEYIEREGEKEGERKWLERNQKQRERFSKQWYVSKYGSEKGIVKWQEYCKNNDRGSLKYFVKKYGEMEGKRRWKERRVKCNSGGMGLENLKLRYGVKEGERRYKDWIQKTMLSKQNSLHYSKVSQELFWNIYENLPDNSFRSRVKFAELNEEQMIKIWQEDLTVIFVDFKIDNKIIEFQGTYWHSFPKVKEKDEKRRKYLEKYGYKILFLEQEEYVNNKITSINKCLKFILDD